MINVHIFAGFLFIDEKSKYFAVVFFLFTYSQFLIVKNLSSVKVFHRSDMDEITVLGMFTSRNQFCRCIFGVMKWCKTAFVNILSVPQ